MPFISSNGEVVSFAEFQDVLDRDQRLFDLNEGINDENVVEPLLIRSTERILTKIQTSEWWQNYYNSQGNTSYSSVNIPSPSASKILERQNDFIDLCVFYALAEYILPMIADFGTEDNNEKHKMGYYKQKADELFMELIKAGDWYDFNNDGTVSSAEKAQGYVNLKRVR